MKPTKLPEEVTNINDDDDDDLPEAISHKKNSSTLTILTTYFYPSNAIGRSQIRILVKDLLKDDTNDSDDDNSSSDIVKYKKSEDIMNLLLDWQNHSSAIMV